MRHLGRVSAFSLLLAAILAWSPAEVGAQKKKDRDKNKDSVAIAMPADYKQIENRKDLTGTIVGVSGSTVTFRIDTPHLEPNPKFKVAKTPQGNQQAQMLRAQQNLMRQQQQAMAAKTPQQRQQAMQRYYQELARFQQQYGQQYNKLMQQYNKANKGNNPNNTTDPFIVVTASKDYELDMKDKIVVRKMYLPLEFDDAGKAKVYTDKEKAKLRGDDKSKPGYSAAMEEVAPGAEAKLYLSPPVRKKSDAKPDDDGVGNVDRPTVNMIVLTKESATPTIVGDNGKGKKKNKK